MFKDINFRRIAYGVGIGFLLLMVIILAISTYQLKKYSSSLQDNLITTNKKIARLELELNTFKNLTSDEFQSFKISTWQSFARVRNNFLAIGHGYHLEEDDFIPPEAYAIAKESNP